MIKTSNRSSSDRILGLGHYPLDITPLPLPHGHYPLGYYTPGYYPPVCKLNKCSEQFHYFSNGLNK